MDSMVDELSRDVFCLGGVPIDILDLAAAEERIIASIRQGERCFVSTPNLNFLAACQHDAEFRDAMVLSDLSLADGQPLVWLAKLLGAPMMERVRPAQCSSAFLPVLRSASTFANNKLLGRLCEPGIVNWAYSAVGRTSYNCALSGSAR